MLWFKKEDNLYKVGVTSIYVWRFGKVTKVRLRDEGTRLQSGKSIAWLEGERNFDSVRIEFECNLKLVNKRLLTEPWLVNKSFYSQGWLAYIEPLGNLTLLDPKKENEKISMVAASSRVRCFSMFPDMEMFEIGVECSAVLTKLNEALSSKSKETVIHLVTDDPTSPVEMRRWALQTGNKVVEERREENLFHFIVVKN